MTQVVIAIVVVLHVVGATPHRAAAGGTILLAKMIDAIVTTIDVTVIVPVALMAIVKWKMPVTAAMMTVRMVQTVMIARVRLAYATELI